MAAQAPAATPAQPEEKPAERHDTVTEDEQIAVLAYRYWEERGCPIGSPEVDWERAERQLSAST